MQPGYFKELNKNVFSQLRQFKQGQPKVMDAFNQLAQVASAGGVLDKKTKEMMALGIAVAIRCDDCIGVHVQSLVRMGMTRDELEEVRSEEHTSELQSRGHLVCRLLLEKKKKTNESYYAASYV